MLHSSDHAVSTVNSQSFNFTPAVTDRVFHDHIHLSKTTKSTQNDWLPPYTKQYKTMLQWSAKLSDY